MGRKRKRRKQKQKNNTTSNVTNLPARQETVASHIGGQWTGAWRCDHDMEKYELHDGTVIHLSSHYGPDNRTKVEDCPDFGLYLDHIWKPWWRNESILWADFGLPRNLNVAYDQMLDSYDLAKDGLAVEVSCIGGHGRTGTAAAIMDVLAGNGHKEAIASVRSKYCNRAIESREQEWFVEWAWCRKHNVEPPAKPLTPAPKNKAGYKKSATATATPSRTTGAPKACSLEDHWWSWAAGHARCPNKEYCTLYPKDVLRFNGTNMTQVDNGRPYTPARAAHHIRSEQMIARMWLDTDTRTYCNGYMVPVEGAKGHIPPSAPAAPKQGCKCDTCRYLAKGHGAFLMPGTYAKPPRVMQTHGEWLESMIELQDKLSEHRLANPPVDDAKEIIDTVAVTKKEDTDDFVWFLSNKDEYQRIRVSDSFSPKPPESYGLHPNQIIGEYLWKPGRGWVWDPMCVERK